MDGTTVCIPVIGGTMPAPDCAGNVGAILKAVIGIGLVFSGAIDATAGIPN